MKPYSAHINDVRHTHCAYSLIETILSIAIIGLLLFLLAPSLGGVRDAARSRVNESNLRQHAAILTSYTTDHRDAYPMLVFADATSSVVRCDSAGVAIEMPYFVVSRFWNVGLADAYYAGDYQSPSFTTPFTRNAYPASTEYEMPCVFLADPQFFARETRTYMPRQLRTVRSHEVLFPSQKSLLVAKRPWHGAGETLPHNERRHAIATTDGRAATFRLKDVLANEYREPAFEASVWYSDHTIYNLPLTHTVHGVRGRDLK